MLLGGVCRLLKCGPAAARGIVSTSHSLPVRAPPLARGIVWAGRRSRDRSVPLPSSGRAYLTVQSADKSGILALISHFLYRNGANIVHSDHWASEQNTFFIRIEFTLDDLETSTLQLEEGFGKNVAPKYNMAYRFTYPSQPPRVAILCSQTDHCLRELLWRVNVTKELPCEVPLVIGNHDTLRHVATSHDTAFHHVPVTKDSKAEGESQIRELLAANSIDLVVLARYMQIISPELCAEWVGRMINIHHSFLPAFCGGDPYGQAHKRGVKLIGATAHFVTSVLDEGPIIAQEVVNISHRENRKQLIALGREVERRVLYSAVKSWCEDRVFIDDDSRTVVLA